MNFHKASYKEWLGLVAAVIFWVVSMIFFVYGLSIENRTGIIIGKWDLVFFLAFSLSVANTIVQVIGNDQTKEELGFVLWGGWIASYMLGIGSNINFLYELIAVSIPIVKFLICVGLGVMVEVIPERLFVRFLRACDAIPAVKPSYAPASKPAVSPSVASKLPKSMNPVQSKPVYTPARPVVPEYPIIPTRRELENMPDMDEDEVELPPFLKAKHAQASTSNRIGQ